MFCSTVGPVDIFGESVALSIRTVEASTGGRVCGWESNGSRVSMADGSDCASESADTSMRGDIDRLLSISSSEDSIGEVDTARA